MARVAAISDETGGERDNSRATRIHGLHKAFDRGRVLRSTRRQHVSQAAGNLIVGRLNGLAGFIDLCSAWGKGLRDVSASDASHD
jgi:hypothetical protein